MVPADPAADGAATSPWAGRLPRSPRGLPAGLVTFVMADIEGSTRLFHELGDGYPALLERYRAVLTRACRRHLGIVVETDGDALLAAFADAGDALAACLPAGTVSGAPKVRAMQIIDELEPHRRGPYAGAVGYIDFAGNMDTCIALRTMVIQNGMAHVQAGAGIVADSVPAQEYEETLNKARGLLKAIEITEERAAK